MKVKYGIQIIFSGISLALLMLVETAQAEDFRDQQDRMRNDYYQQQDSQREMNRVRDHEELRQTQSNQQLRYQDQNLQRDKVKKKINQRVHPNEPEIITHDRGEKQIDSKNKELKSDDSSTQKNDLKLPKFNIDKLL